MTVRVPLTTERQSPLTKDANTLPAPRPISVRQIEANQRNALHSTGPTTPEGKQASRLNALTHGLRAKEVIIPGQEDPAGFEAILRELREEWDPKGHTECLLVEQIGLAEWRLCRVRRAELGEIRTQMANPTVDDAYEKIMQVLRLSPDTLPEILAQSTLGVALQRKAIENALDELESEGTVSEKTCLHLERLFGKEPHSVATMLKIWFLGEMPEEEEDDLDSDSEQTLTADEVGPEQKAAARKHLEMVLKALDRRQRKLHRQERTALKIAQQRLSIPQGYGLEKIQRYETEIKRDMYRAIDQLERLQRRRRGEAPPPTVNVNVSKDD